MPTYDYECQDCNYIFESFQSMSAKPLKKCPKCNGKLKRLIGTGAGIIFKGHLYSGTNCGAGEFGNVPYRDHDFEYYCSESYFEEKYGIKFDILLKRAEKKDKIALAIFEQYGFDLGNLIKVILFTTDPQIIILGGLISKAFPYFEKSMWEKVRTFIYKHTIKKLKIVPAKQQDIAILGAAALYIDGQNIEIKK